jgi:hypothetical protein
VTEERRINREKDNKGRDEKGITGKRKIGFYSSSPVTK